MKILVLEPGYFASQQCFAACMNADKIILADNVRYRKKSKFNRTRIRNATKWQWLSIPLLPNMRKNPIYQVKTEDSSTWNTTHKRGLDYNYRTSPYYEHFEDYFISFFEAPYLDLSDWTFESMLLSCRLLGIDKDITRASRLDDIPKNMEDLIQSLDGSDILVHGDDWWLDQVSEENRSVYNWKEEQYHQNFEGFESGMSILDLLFNHGPESLPYLKKCIELT